MSSLVPGPGILDIAPYVGGQSSAEGVERVIKLASNETPLGPSPRAIEAYTGLAGELHRYPAGGADTMCEALGDHYGLDPARIVCGNGSDELIGLLARAYAGPSAAVVHSAHGFLMYKIAAQAAGSRAVAAPETDDTADVDALLAAAGPTTRVVFLANPNNPTGTYLTADALRRLRERLADHVLLVIDSAYAEYVERDDYSPGIDLVAEYDNVVMTRTFSKIYGLSALRLGWAYCPTEIADVLHRVRGPFNVNAPAQTAGVAALRDTAYTANAKAHNQQWLPWLSKGLGRLGLEVVPSVANFVLVRFPRTGKSAAAASAHLTKRGILVRAVGAYGLPDCLRITVGLEDENRAVLAALGAFVG